jgi:hypothetical protein
MLRITTESGRVYDVDTEAGFWYRHPKAGEYQNGWERLWEFKAHAHYSEGRIDWPHADDTWEDRCPVAGEHLYVSCRDKWWISTAVATVEEVPTIFD